MTFEPNEVQLGPAIPRQAIAAAVLIFDTDPALWNCLFSNDVHSALRFFGEEWQAEESVFSYSLCTGATLDGELMGIELGFDRPTQKRYRSGTGQRGGACLSPETLKGFSENAGYISYLIPPIPKEVYYIQFLSIAPQVRGRGLGGGCLATRSSARSGKVTRRANWTFLAIARRWSSTCAWVWRSCRKAELSRSKNVGCIFITEW